jgi:hypothetical protein
MQKSMSLKYEPPPEPEVFPTLQRVEGRGFRVWRFRAIHTAILTLKEGFEVFPTPLTLEEVFGGLRSRSMRALKSSRSRRALRSALHPIALGDEGLRLRVSGRS